MNFKLIELTEGEMRKNLDDLKLVVDPGIEEVTLDIIRPCMFREFAQVGPRSATLDGVFLSESETKAVRKVIYAAAY